MADYFAHESAYIDDGAVVGRGTKIWHFSHVMPGAVIGEHCNLGQNVVVMPGTVLGDNVKVQNNVSIYEGVTLEDDVFCGPSCVFTNVINPRSHVSRKSEYKRTLVRRGSTIGANATVVCGVTLGEYCFVGAGAVITADVLPYALVVGVPARRVGWMCRCGERLLPKEGRGICAACGAWYQEFPDGLRPIDPEAGGV
jgi:UDP-2-acetamido-3-amino-2,3-dideoxy-glucuronate N-acetyltransferase